MSAYQDKTQGIAFVFPKETLTRDKDKLNQFEVIRKNLDNLGRLNHKLHVILSDILHLTKGK